MGWRVGFGVWGGCLWLGWVWGGSFGLGMVLGLGVVGFGVRDLGLGRHSLGLWCGVLGF